jgi:hypothetical protein
MGENEPLLPRGLEDDDRPPPRMTIGRFLNKHKRGIIFGGAGVLGGAAIVGGIVGGILDNSTKREKTTMQSNEPRGMFEQLSAGPVSTSGGGGGGGGGGFARYNQIQAAARQYKSGGAVKRRKKRGGKKHTNNNKAQKKAPHRRKKGVRHGRVGKGKRKKTVCRINKKGKKVCGGKRRKTAF